MITHQGKTFHLGNKNFSYVMYINEENSLINYHIGKPIADVDYSEENGALEPFPSFNNSVRTINLSAWPQEYPTYGHIDMRTPAAQVIGQHGSPVSSLTYSDYKIYSGKAIATAGMPSLYGSLVPITECDGGACHLAGYMTSEDGDADTLEIILGDVASGYEVHLFYTVFENYDIVARHAVIKNICDKAITINKAASINIDLPINNYDLVYFAGDWGQERRLERVGLHRGATTVVADNTGRGSRWVNPAVIIASPDADEDHGDVYGFNLIYSGNHESDIDMDTSGHVRVVQGISSRDFSWELKPGESFTTPQSVLCYSSDGFGQMSREYHRLYKNQLMRSKFKDMQRPVLINSWESAYFDFDEDKLLRLAEKSVAAGIELFVLDDGWFGKRNDAHSSLGDWTVNLEKLPSGIDGLAKKINDIGMKFGLWVEPEMISPDSDLYRAHPDWAIRVDSPHLEPTLYRWQYVLDLTRDDVCDYVIKSICNIIGSANIEYIKWDMNRMISDVPSEGFYHRYTLGYYRIAEAITRAFPHVLFEGCCSGGGRFDAGVLAFMPQIWTSDDTDAVMRLKIQYSTSMFYPLSSMAAHVSAVPNHQTNRITPLKTRGDVALLGMFGYELNLCDMSDEEIAEISKQAEYAKHIQKLIRDGNLYRLRSPYKGQQFGDGNPFISNECAFEVVSDDKSHAFVMACRVLAVLKRNRHYEPAIKLYGLDEAAVYEDVLTGKRYSGSVLMNHGITMDYAIEDFATVIMEFKKI